MTIDVDQMHKVDNDLLTFILNDSQSLVPIKLSDLNAISTPAVVKQSLSRVKENLATKFGLELVEVPEGKGPKRFITVNRTKGLLPCQLTAKDRQQFVLLRLILTYIFLHEGSVTEEELFEYLMLMEIDVNEEHSYFGSDLKKLITDTFVKQLYLKREKKTDAYMSDGYFAYSWGFRSSLEFNRVHMLEDFAKHIKRPVKYLSLQLKRAQQTEEQHAEEEAAALAALEKSFFPEEKQKTKKSKQ